MTKEEILAKHTGWEVESTHPAINAMQEYATQEKQGWEPDGTCPDTKRDVLIVIGNIQRVGFYNGRRWVIQADGKTLFLNFVDLWRELPQKPEV